MIVKCEQCKTRFRLADEKVPPSGVQVRCARCRHVFRVHRVSALRQQHHIPPAPVPFAPLPPVEENDPFSFFGEPAQTGTSEPTRPGIFLPGVEASRRAEEGKASMQPPRVPVFGGGAIPKLFTEKMAEQAGGAVHSEASSFLSATHADEAFSETVKLDSAFDAIRVEYFASEQPASQSHSHAEPVVSGTQKVPSFSIPSSLREPLLREKEQLSDELLLEDVPMGSERRVPVQEFSAQEFSAQEFFAQESSSQESSEHGALASLLSAASEDIVQEPNASELRRANESEIRRAFVQSKTKVKRRKRWRRVLKVLALLLVAAFILSGGAVYWKEGQVLNRKPNGQVDWGKSFSWERLKKNLFSRVVEKDAASGLYAMHVGQHVFYVQGEAAGAEPSQPQG